MGPVRRWRDPGAPADPDFPGSIDGAPVASRPAEAEDWAELSDDATATRAAPVVSTPAISAPTMEAPAVPPVIALRNVSRTYRMGEVDVHALAGVSLVIERGEFVAIMGASGSGKSTMMNVIGCLDVPSRGRYWLDGVDVRHLDEGALARIRNRKIGFVFQSFNLIPRTTALANVELPLGYAGVPVRERRARALAALEMVGLADRTDHVPSEMSGGQQQRVAVARAIVTNPSLILADEPTGNLDTRSSEDIMQIFAELNRAGRTVVLITHEADIAAYTRRVIRLRDGLIISDDRTDDRQVAVG